MKRTITLFFLIFLYRSGFGQTLYQCSSPDRDTVTYIFCTYHHIPKEDFTHRHLLDSLISLSNVIFVEPYTDDGQPGFEEKKQALQEASRFQENDRLADYMTKAEMKKVYRYYQRKLSVPPDYLDQQSRWTPLFMDRKLCYPDSLFIQPDSEIIGMAKAEKKKLVNLNDPAYLVKTFKTISKYYNPSWLLEFMKYGSPGKNMQQRAYIKQDTGYFHTMLQHTGQDDLSILSEPLAHWHQVIERNSAQTNFICAGISQVLLPQEGLLAWYKNHGYSVLAIPD